MTGRASRANRLLPSFIVVATALACGSSHGGGGDDDGGGEGGSGGTSTGISGFGANPPQPGTGGVTGPNPAGGVGGPSTGGVATAGTFGVAGFGTAGFATGGIGTGGVGPIGGTGGSAGAKNPPGSCPPQPPPNGTSCANYFVNESHHCYYDAPACRVVSTCLTGDKWRSGCEAPGTAGASNEDGGAGGAEN